MLVEIKKISTRPKKVDGREVKNPESGKAVMVTVVESELIKVSEIRSVRKWNKSVEDELEVEGDIIVLYLTGDPSKKALEVKINESFNEFKKRVPCVSID